MRTLMTRSLTRRDTIDSRVPPARTRHTSVRAPTLAVAAFCVAAGAAASFAQPPAAPAPARTMLIEAAREIMTKTGICAVITVDETGRPQARAIDAFPPDEKMVVWFATNPKTRKVDQLKRDPRVTLYYYDPAAMEYVTLLGRARLVDDPAEKQRRWKDSFRAFWADRGAGYLLVEVTPERIEVVSPKRKIFNDPATWLPAAVTFDAVRKK
jgi:general stress protein 26